MKWSFKIGRYAGIDVYMHVTFLLLIGWVALLHWRQGQSITAALVGVVFILAVFNMIPAFPMDGGRVLRAILATRQEYSRATQIAASIGQGIAVFFGLIGLFYNPLLIFIAFFVWIGASQEAGEAQMRSAVGRIPVQRAMMTDFKVIHRNDSLDRAIELTLAGAQKDFPVADNGHVEGILTQADLLKDCKCHTLPVTLDRKMVGLLTMENLGEYMRIQAALKS